MTSTEFSKEKVVDGIGGKLIGSVCECGERLSDDMQCLACERRYESREGGLKKV